MSSWNKTILVPEKDRHLLNAIRCKVCGHTYHWTELFGMCNGCDEIINIKNVLHKVKELKELNKQTVHNLT